MLSLPFSSQRRESGKSYIIYNRIRVDGNGNLNSSKTTN